MAPKVNKNMSFYDWQGNLYLAKKEEARFGQKIYTRMLEDVKKKLEIEPESVQNKELYEKYSKTLNSYKAEYNKASLKLSELFKNNAYSNVSSDGYTFRLTSDGKASKAATLDAARSFISKLNTDGKEGVSLDEFLNYGLKQQKAFDGDDFDEAEARKQYTQLYNVINADKKNPLMDSEYASFLNFVDEFDGKKDGALNYSIKSQIEKILARSKNPQAKESVFQKKYNDFQNGIN